MTATFPPFFWAPAICEIQDDSSCGEDDAKLWFSPVLSLPSEAAMILQFGSSLSSLSMTIFKLQQACCIAMGNISYILFCSSMSWQSFGENNSNTNSVRINALEGNHYGSTLTKYHSMVSWMIICLCWKQFYTSQNIVFVFWMLSPLILGLGIAYKSTAALLWYFHLSISSRSSCFILLIYTFWCP